MTIYFALQILFYMACAILAVGIAPIIRDLWHESDAIAKSRFPADKDRTEP